ncbi:MAG: hypothetical protein V1824_02215, partial [archaeon]
MRGFLLTSKSKKQSLIYRNKEISSNTLEILRQKRIQFRCPEDIKNKEDLEKMLGKLDNIPITKGVWEELNNIGYWGKDGRFETLEEKFKKELLKLPYKILKELSSRKSEINVFWCGPGLGGELISANNIFKKYKLNAKFYTLSLTDHITTEVKSKLGDKLDIETGVFEHWFNKDLLHKIDFGVFLYSAGIHSVRPSIVSIEAAFYLAPKGSILITLLTKDILLNFRSKNDVQKISNIKPRELKSSIFRDIYLKNLEKTFNN